MLPQKHVVEREKDFVYILPARSIFSDLLQQTDLLLPWNYSTISPRQIQNVQERFVNIKGGGQGLSVVLQVFI